MIIELRTLQLKIAAGPAVEEAFAKALPARTALSPLGGMWHSEVDTLNQVIMLWPYANVEDRARVLKDAARLPNWPPDIRQFQIEEDVMVLEAMPFCPPVTPRKLGNIYEFRTYTYGVGFMPEAHDPYERLDEASHISPVGRTVIPEWVRFHYEEVTWARS
jgi:hypothetical protein